jgi:hypothetical protein
MDQATKAAQFLVGQRRIGAILTDDFPDGLAPRTADAVVAIQVATIALLGLHGGWKVGAPDPESAAVVSPLPGRGIASLPGAIRSRLGGVEAEIGFRFGDALPPRDRPYSRAETLAAIASCHATIEILDPRFSRHADLDPLVATADLGMHAGLVVGPPIPSWSPDMFSALGVALDVGGQTVRTALASNPGGVDLLRLLTGLANSPVVRALGGIRAGDIATTGSWTGLVIVPAGATAIARFAGFPPVEAAIMPPSPGA